MTQLVTYECDLCCGKKDNMQRLELVQASGAFYRLTGGMGGCVHICPGCLELLADMFRKMEEE